VGLCLELNAESVSTHGIESTFNIICPQASNYESTTLSIHDKPENLENLLGSRRSAPLTKLVLPAISDSSEVQPESEAAAPVLRFSMWRLFDTCESPAESTLTPRLPESQTQPLNNLFLQQVNPASAFELSPSFRPETYKISDTTPRLISYDNRELYADDYTRADRCTMFFATTPRQWIRLLVSITTTVDSLYWNLGRAKMVNTAMKGPITLPTRIKSYLQTFLDDSQILKKMLISAFTLASNRTSTQTT